MNEQTKTSKGARRGALPKAAVIVALTVAGALVLGLLLRRGGAADRTGPERATYTVTGGELDVTVTESGELRTANPIKITSEVSGQATIADLVEEGKRVKAGDVLVVLDASSLEEQRTKQEIDVENANARLVQSKEDKRIQEINNETDIANAKLGLKNAQMELAKYGEVALDDDGFLDETVYSSDSAPDQCEAYQAFRDAELEIKRKQTDLDKANRDFEGMDKLCERGVFTKNDYIERELKVLEAQRSLESARLKAFLLRAYTYPKQREQLEADVRKAEAALTQAEISTASKMRQKEAAINQAQRSHDRSKKQLEETLDQLSKMTITAPEDGLVIYGDERRWWERDQIKIGGTVHRGTVILTLPRVSKMLAAVEIAEKDINKIKVDQSAKITMSALPDLDMTGKVTKIGSVASEQSRRRGSDVKSFEVEVALDVTDKKMKPGMSCEVSVLIDTVPDCLYVPVNAVFEQDDKDVCYLPDGQNIVAAPVTLGESNGMYVAVKSGLCEGQDVLLYSVVPSEVRTMLASDESTEDADAAGEKAQTAEGEAAPAAGPTETAESTDVAKPADADTAAEAAETAESAAGEGEAAKQASETDSAAGETEPAASETAKAAESAAETTKTADAGATEAAKTTDAAKDTDTAKPAAAADSSSKQAAPAVKDAAAEPATSTSASAGDKS